MEILREYLSGAKTMDDCYEWLAGVDWDDPCLESDMRKILGGLELLAIEAYEGIRNPSEFYEEASNLVANATELNYVVPNVATER